MIVTKGDTYRMILKTKYMLGIAATLTLGIATAFTAEDRLESSPVEEKTEVQVETEVQEQEAENDKEIDEPGESIQSESNEVVQASLVAVQGVMQVNDPVFSEQETVEEPIEEETVEIAMTIIENIAKPTVQQALDLPIQSVVEEDPEVVKETPNELVQEQSVSEPEINLLPVSQSIVEETPLTESQLVIDQINLDIVENSVEVEEVAPVIEEAIEEEIQEEIVQEEVLIESEPLEEIVTATPEEVIVEEIIEEVVEKVAEKESPAVTYDPYANPENAGLVLNAALFKDDVANRFGITSFSLVRPGDPGDHGTGRAVDFMVPVGSQLGDEIANYAINNMSRFGISYIIWEQKIYGDWNYQWEWMNDRGSITANHYDHVHISFY